MAVEEPKPPFTDPLVEPEPPPPTVIVTEPDRYIDVIFK
jgi:hypothetical protein